MEYAVIASIVVATLVVGYFIFRKRTKDPYTKADRAAQRQLDEYHNSNLPPEEIGRLYERYIGYLYEADGYDVKYNGANNGVQDMGRDLIVTSVDEAIIVQTKCWAKFKMIPENHIFQLYGSMTHSKLTSKFKNRSTKAVFYTTARFSDVAKDVANVLGVELKVEFLNRTYPMIKCCVTENGDMNYYLPFDPYYDQVKIEPQKGDFFTHTVREAVEKGFHRASKYSGAA